MFKVLRWITLGVLAIPVLMALGAVALAFYTLEHTAVVARNAPADYTTVAAGKALVKRIKIQVEAADANGTRLAVTEDELKRLAQLGSHTFNWLDTALNFDSDGIHSRASVQLPANPFGRYLNLGVNVAPSNDGLVVERITVGPLEFSGRWLLPMAARLVDVLLPDKQASTLLASVHGLRIDGDTAVLRVFPPPDVKAQLKAAVRTLQASRFPPGEEERTVHYYEVLLAIGGWDTRFPLSLNHYLTPLMAEAAQRSIHTSAVVENRAVIWALVIYFSNGAFENLLGKMVSGQRRLVYSPARVTLADRQDLMLHFLYSAGIALATQQGVGVAAGEFKELLDSGNGGSGFSFADLAADRAGLSFVTAATTNEEQARQLQERFVARIDEADFFPDIAGLQEGFSEEEFVRAYGSVRSRRYLRQVETIDQRINDLPLYRGQLVQ
ncbi:MAG: hypothetical protein R3E64_02550 [Halioglobus sp.]